MGNVFVCSLLYSMSGFPEVTDEQARYAIRLFNVEGSSAVMVVRICQVKFNRYAAWIKSYPGGDRVAG